MFFADIVTLAPDLVIESRPPYGRERVLSRGRQIFSPPGDVVDEDHIAAGHFHRLDLVGEWNAGGAHRWVFSALGIDDCHSYGVWVLDLRGGRASMRRVMRMCTMFRVEISSRTPLPRALVTLSKLDGVTGEERKVRVALPLDPQP